MILNIKQERINKGWSLQYVATQLGITTEAVRLIETAQRHPSYDVLVKLENLFEKTHRELFAVASDAPISPRNNNKL